MEFFVSIEREKKGPLTHFQIHEMLRSGELEGDTLCWHKGMDAWKPIREVSSLQGSLQSLSQEQAELVADEESDIAHERHPNLCEPHEENFVAEAAAVEASQSKVEVRPFRRFWARTFDHYLVTIILIAVVGPPALEIDPDSSVTELMRLYLRELSNPEWQRFSRMLFFGYLGWHFVEGILLNIFGTTPGKALLGIHLRQEDGSFPTLLRGLARSFYVYIVGVFFYLAPFSLIGMVLGFIRLLVAGRTHWDEHLNYIVKQRPLSGGRILLAVMAFLGLVIGQAILST